MAKLSQINRNKKREKMVAQYAEKRATLKARAEDQSVAPEERFNARLKLAKREIARILTVTTERAAQAGKR